ncbi:hypothetical protein BD779DRAFT_1671685 [Infundibulicybe gibba]|nr:hypothetical protein BD779DRAFT_1671685 [Infundibulicybe gibba]
MDFSRLPEDALVDIQTTNYLVAASATLLIFDHIITVEQEVALIWRRPWNISSLLYIWNRYYALISLVIYSSYMFRIINSDKARHSPPTSNYILTDWRISRTLKWFNQYVMFQGFGGPTLSATVDTILAFRVWILYEKSQKLLWFLIALISAEFITMCDSIVTCFFTIYVSP